MLPGALLAGRTLTSRGFAPTPHSALAGAVRSAARGAARVMRLARKRVQSSRFEPHNGLTKGREAAIDVAQCEWGPGSFLAVPPAMQTYLKP